MAHQFDVWAAQKGAGLSRCVRARIVIVNNDSSSLLRFSTYCEDFRQTNCGVPLRIDRPTMLKWNCRHMTSFAEEIGDHLLRSASSTNNVRWIWLVFEDSHYQFTHGINGRWHNGCFWTNFMDVVFEWASPTIEFIKPVFHSTIRWRFIAKQRFNFFAKLIFSSYCKQYKWWPYVKTFWVPLC